MSLLETIHTLYSDYGHVSGITIECQKELIAIGVQNKAAKAEVFLQGAQIAQYQRQGSPILWLSQSCDYQQGKPLRGGIPICWPWFGDLDKNPESLVQQFSDAVIEKAPAHGFVRDREWRLNRITTPSEDLTIIEFSYSLEQGAEILWPFATELTYVLEIGHHLSASLTVKNCDSRSVIFTGALHSYFSVDHIHHARISGFDNTTYIDAVNQWQLAQQKGDIQFGGEVDRIYSSAPETIVLEGGQQPIHIMPSGSQSTVIWNPWIEKAQRLSQFDDQDYLTMLCIETANAGDNIICLNPDESHSLKVEIR